jgi:pimeloyl-ACP methyl ester carboxylesterase
MQRRLVSLGFITLLGFFILNPDVTFAQGRVVDEVVYSPALEGNWLGDSPDREVTVYLPPGYDEREEKRYPTLYLLHGFLLTHQFWSGTSILGELLLIDVPAIADRLIGSGTIAPMIIVMPNAFNQFLGSFYTNSSVTGNWEDFIVRELVDHMDRTYRTIPSAQGRGIAGHSMGGYGALILAMKHPETYSAVYGISPCCVGLVEPEVSLFGSAFWPPTLQLEQVEQISEAAFETLAHLALAAAWSPNRDSPPFFADFPFELVDDQARLIEPVWDQWKTHTPLGMLDEFGHVGSSTPRPH